MLLRHRTLGLFIAGLSFVFAGTAGAEPHFAVREGLMCSACHVNQTGMGKRTLFGVEFSQSTLPVIKTGSAESNTVLDRNITEFLSIGGDVRLLNTTSLPEVTTLAGTTEVSNGFGFYEANLYAEITIKRDRFSLYVDEQMAPGGATNRELVGIVKVKNGYIKVGRLILPYGWRLWDFDAYIRSQTNLLNQDFGAEVGVETGKVSFQAAVSNGEPFGGSESNTGKQFSMRLAAVGPKAQFGGSFAVNSEDPAFNASPQKRQFIMAGPFFGLAGGPIALLGEVDLIRGFNVVKGDYDVRIAAYGEANVLLRQGVNAKVAFDFLDPRDGRGQTAKRVRIGLEPTVTEYLQIRAFYDVRRPRGFFDPLFSPPNSPNQDTLTLELHLMF